MVAAKTLTLDTAVADASADPGAATATPIGTPVPSLSALPALSAGSVFHYEQCRLANDRVALEPFDLALHLGQSVKRLREHPGLLTYMPFPALDDEDAFVRDVWSYISKSPADALYAVRDLSSSNSIAGFISLSGTNPMNASTELGIILFPEFHHTHVSVTAVGLMLQWLMDPVAGQGSQGSQDSIQSAEGGRSTAATTARGLGLRRVEWKTHSENVASRKLADRIGFELEGICRWERIVQPGKPGLAADWLQRRNGSPVELQGQHMALYSIVWDEWDQKRQHIVAEMET
ncbi:acyl- n-acyltransferase [Ophiostoma piceae UAMH 11346]|uniref:Acyl-n-acyltransferase n=1 Tax=Ophiostoma piceae (strain UAMH 11346) TaxID=1262450 RepID=S3CC26_OPHP1|nr:acyl- n-acyltransferase [Ophiostoma piceae UAMH 11346]